MSLTKENHPIFGLDIGTRTVIGIVGRYAADQFQIEAYSCVAHQKRAMLDGQIHDIHAVCEVVKQVKKDLEQQLGYSLTQVAIAAAGRVLTTQIVDIGMSFEENREVTREDIEKLELLGVQKALHLVAEKQVSSSGQAFCVGHSVISYTLDEYSLFNLEGHKGTHIGAKVLATFLPKGVIDSLYAVTEQAGLEVIYMTLEPIAAINAIIPENLRLLNLGLVDVGAGTSDIAITKEGSIVAYGMIATAGDELTECIVHTYLVDFQTAEKIKQQLETEETICFEDILGIPYEVPAMEIKQLLHKEIVSLAHQIGEKIKTLNGEKPTSAVFCVGGGSQIGSFTDEVAKVLQLPSQRVSLRTGLHIPNISYPSCVAAGPDMITPVGICLTALQNQQKHLCRIICNGMPMELLASKKLTILDVIIHMGITPEDLFTTHGKTLQFYLDNQRIRIKGESGTPAIILKNGKKASLQDYIVANDAIDITFSVKGKDAQAIVTEYIPLQKEVLVEGKRICLPLIYVNEEIVAPDYSLQENDAVSLHYLDTVVEILHYLYGEEGTHLATNCTVNQQCVDGSYLLSDQDEILFSPISKENIVATQTISIPENEMWVMVNNKKVFLPPSKEHYIFARIFDYIDFDLSRPQGTIRLLLNKQEAMVTDILQPADQIEIYWEK